jgi:hypothetical protein
MKQTLPAHRMNHALESIGRAQFSIVAEIPRSGIIGFCSDTVSGITCGSWGQYVCTLNEYNLVCHPSSFKARSCSESVGIHYLALATLSASE